MPDRYSSRWFLVSHLLAAGVGIVGLIAPPSPAVASVLGEQGAPWAMWAWSLAFVLAGVLGTVAQWRRWLHAEAAAIDTMAGVYLLWAAMVILASPRTGIQAALGFALAAAFMHGSARGRRRGRVTTVAAVAVRQAFEDAMSRETEGQPGADY